MSSAAIPPSSKEDERGRDVAHADVLVIDVADRDRQAAPAAPDISSARRVVESEREQFEPRAGKHGIAVSVERLQVVEKGLQIVGVQADCGGIMVLA